jgi:hypothetical protein
VAKVLKHGHENVTNLSQSMVEKTVVIWDILLNIGYVLQSLALVSDMVLYKVNSFPLAITFLPHYSLLKP